MSRHHHFTFPAALIVPASVTLAACSGGAKSSPTAAGTTDNTQGSTAATAPATTAASSAKGGTPAGGVCGLISPQEASAAFDVDAGAPQPVAAVPPSDAQGCEYRSGVTDNGSFRHLDFAASHTNAKLLFGARSQIHNGGHDVAGIGDGAFAYPGGGSSSGIFVIKGSSGLHINLDIPDATARDQALVVLAKAAAGRL